MYGGKYDNLDNLLVNKVNKVVCTEYDIAQHIATLGSLLYFQLSWKSGKVQLTRWSLKEAGLKRAPPIKPPTHPPPQPNLLYSSLSVGCLQNVWVMSGRCLNVSGRGLSVFQKYFLLSKIILTHNYFGQNICWPKIFHY